MGSSTHTKSLDAPRQFPNYVVPPRLRTNLRLHARKRRNYITFPSACGRGDVFSTGFTGLSGLGARRFLTQRHRATKTQSAGRGGLSSRRAAEGAESCEGGFWTGFTGLSGLSRRVRGEAGNPANLVNPV